MKSGEVRRERKKLKEELLLLLSENDIQKRLSLALIDKALSGDVRAFETIRDTIGEKPTDKQEITELSGEYPKIFIFPDDLQDVEKMKRLLNGAMTSEIVFVTPKKLQEIDNHINKFIGEC